jgi:hypothetical protein
VTQWVAAVALLRLLTLNTSSLQAAALAAAVITFTHINTRLDTLITTLVAAAALAGIAQQQVWLLRRVRQLPSQ